MKIHNELTESKIFSLKAIRVSSFFFGIFAVTLMVISNLKVFEKKFMKDLLLRFLKKNTPNLITKKF